MALESALETLAQGFRIGLDASGADDRRFVASLLPPDKRELVVTDLVTTTEVVPAPVDLSWRTKDVRFANTDVGDAAIVGGMPVDELLAVNAATVTTGPAAAAGRARCGGSPGRDDPASPGGDHPHRFPPGR